MSSFSDFLLPIVQKVNMYLSDYILIVLLIGAGLFYTFKTKFVQVRCFNEGMKNLFSKQKESQKGMSPFQALATAIAAQVGTGNIVGACGNVRNRYHAGTRLYGCNGAVKLNRRNL